MNKKYEVSIFPPPNVESMSPEELKAYLSAEIKKQFEDALEDYTAKLQAAGEDPSAGVILCDLDVEVVKKQKALS